MGTNRLPVQTTYVDLLRDNIIHAKEKTEPLSDTSKDMGLEVTAKKTSYLLMSGYQNAGKIGKIWLTDPMKSS